MAPSKTYPSLYLLSSRFVISRAFFGVGIPTASTLNDIAFSGDFGGNDAPPTSAADLLRCRLEPLEGGCEEADSFIDCIANFFEDDRRVTAAAVDDTPSVLGVDALRCIAIDVGGGDSGS